MDGAVTEYERARRFLPFGKDAPEEDVIARLLSHRAQLWTREDCAGVTELTDDNRLHIWLAGGSLWGLLAMLDSVEGFASVMGCSAVVLGGRKGWQRVMVRFGFVPDGQEMVKVLRHER